MNVATRTTNIAPKLARLTRFGFGIRLVCIVGLLMTLAMANHGGSQADVAGPVGFGAAGFVQTSDVAHSVITLGGRSNDDRNLNGRADDRTNPLSPFASRLHSRRPPRQDVSSFFFGDDPTFGGGFFEGVQVQMVEGVLNINCDDQNQRILVYENPQSLLAITYAVVDDDGDPLFIWLTQVFPVESVDHILVFLNGGNDTFLNYSVIDCTVYAGPGNDIVIGGYSDDALYGEGGGDAIFGAFGSDYIEGGAQSDLLCGGCPDGLIDFATLDFIHDNFNLEWISAGEHIDYDVDTMRGGPDSAIDANWFLQEVLPDENDDAFENDIIVDYLEDFDWISFNEHFWE